MKFYISTTGVKRIAAGGGEGGDIWRGMKTEKSTVGRRLARRSAMLLLGLVMPLLLFRTAFLVLDSAAICPSSIGCVTRRFFGGSDAMLREELMRALLEAASSNEEFRIRTPEDSNVVSNSFVDLVNNMMSNSHDIKAFAINTKAMIENMEHLVQAAKMHESIYWQLAAHGVPQSLHCLSLKLAEEYAINAMARSRLPPPQYIHHLTNAFYNHVVLLTDNVLAASVVISSAVKNSINPENLVFHVVTDKKSYTSMHSWFAVNMIHPAVVEVKGLHQYDWSHEVNVGIKEILEIHHQMRNQKYREMKKGFEYFEESDHKLDVLNPSYISILNHIRIYLPQLFPDLDKVVILDDDVVVQHDLSSLWEIDLNQKVVGAVVDSWCGRGCCPGRKYKDYFNFMEPLISSTFDPNRCGWLHGMNIFDLKQWRKTNITATYHHWLKLNLNSGFTLWHPGALPPALIAFESYVHPLDPPWHLAGLGYRHPKIDKYTLEAAAVVHFSGPAKPWLEIGSPEVRHLWYIHVNESNEYVRRCGITG